MNVASRIADVAEAGDVLTAEETMRQVDDDAIDWERVGSAALQGVAGPVALYRATRRRSSGGSESPAAGGADAWLKGLATMT